MRKGNLNRYVYIALVLLFAFSLVNTFLLTARTKKVGEAMEIAKELRRPALLEVIKIVPADCRDCYDVEKALAVIKNQNVDITNETVLRFDSRDAKSLIKLHRIENVPAVVISGEVNKTEQLQKFFEKNGLVIDNKTAVYTNIQPPYYDVKKGEVVGRVTIIHIVDSSCKECAALQNIVAFLKQAGVGIAKESSHEYDSPEGSMLIREYDISRVPTMLVSEDISYYPELKPQLEAAGGQLRNGYYVLHTSTPPYRDIKENRVVGLVGITLLKDDACKECYDVNIHKQILARMGLALQKEAAVSISSEQGKELVKKYAIMSVPTVILNGDVAAYKFFTQIWPQAGSIEDDGTYVFRHLSVLGPGIKYKDLKTGTIIENKPPQREASSDDEPVVGEERNE